MWSGANRVLGSLPCAQTKVLGLSNYSLLCCFLSILASVRWIEEGTFQMHVGWQWCFWPYGGNTVPNNTVRRNSCYNTTSVVLYERHSTLSVVIVSQQSPSMPVQVVLFSRKTIATFWWPNDQAIKTPSELLLWLRVLVSVGNEVPAINLTGRDLGTLGPVENRAYHSGGLIPVHFYYSQPILSS